MESEVIMHTDGIHMFFNVSNCVVNDLYNRKRLIQAFFHMLFHTACSFHFENTLTSWADVATEIFTVYAWTGTYL